ncbi:L-type lectin-domain containing receptor kinase IX.2-like [Triticum urartu]|uniref:L-type lectin-domain containing receptor kinase IX.2-like n=1 Tax=Triticum urartu TaxID=4572 RepID=UPI002043A0CC|nr:L-type lectin-domain containing receptor kinase IX.2-like [Triticum urartu]
MTEKKNCSVRPMAAGTWSRVAGCLFSFLLSHDHVVIAHAATASPAPPLSFSFGFANTSDYSLQDLRFEGDAALNGDLVDLTCNSVESKENYYCKGRMSYNHPIPLYDKSTGEVASFATTFIFAIHLIPNRTKKGDGLTFFLSTYPSRLPPESSSNLLGLISSSDTSAVGEDRFVAVEFDTYSNPWDPTGASDHIGIDLSSVTSVSTTRLPSYSLNGTMTATITFVNTTRTLEAILHFDYSNHSLAAARVKTQLPDPLDALLPPVVAVGFSAATGGNTELHQIHSWSFNSTMAPRARGRDNSLIIGGAVVVALALVVIIWSILSWCRWTRTRDSFGTGTRLKRFEYREVSTATDGFSDKKKIGAGGFGVVYSGSLKADQPVAVKKILKDSRGEFKDFLAELDAVGRTGHGNVVRLEGWCCSINNFMFWCLHRQNVKLFLVYELVPNGNLHEHLHERPEVLSWARRYKIVKGIGSALHYLPHLCKPCILHRDIKPSHILLDHDFNAKHGDFGLSRVAQYGDDTSLITAVAVGTADYMDPLCKKHGQVKLRPSSDVYSFGIVLLEILHGENNPDLLRKLHRDQPETFVSDAADKKLDGQFDKIEMERVIVLALQCCDLYESQRPSMPAAILFLENGGELPPATPDRSTPP